MIYNHSFALNDYSGKEWGTYFITSDEMTIIIGNKYNKQEEIMLCINSANRDNIDAIFTDKSVYNRKTNASSNEFSTKIESIDTLNAGEKFKKLPGINNHALNLFHAIASEQLPSSLSSTGLDYEANIVKSMLGIIYKDSDPADEDKFKKVFSEFETVKGDILGAKDKVSSELGYLFNKYGHSANDKHITNFIQHCRDAWHYHHNASDRKINDKDIFSDSLIGNKNVLDANVNELSHTNQSWASILSSGINFTNSCAAISKLLQYHNAVAPESVRQNQPPMQEPGNPSSIGGNASVPPINISNIAHGGNGISTINGHSNESHVATLLDFGIAVSNAPSENYTPEQRTHLTQQIIHLLEGRVKNGGQDKFTDYIQSQVFSPKAVQADIKILPSPLEMRATNTIILRQEPQFAKAVMKPDSLTERERTLSHRGIESESITNNKSSLFSVDNRIFKSNQAELVSDEPDAYLLAPKNIRFAAKMVNQGLSDFINEAEPVNSKLSNKSIKSDSQVQKIIKKFEKLNVNPQPRSQSIDSRHHLASTSNQANDKPSVLTPTSDKLEFRPFVASYERAKVTVPQKPLYTTNRTIDPFSRHSAQLHSVNKLPTSRDQIVDIPLVDDAVINL